MTDAPAESIYRSVELVIAGASIGSGVCGTLRFGEGAVPPPAQAPDEEYPPVPDAPKIANEPFPGFPYSFISGHAEVSGISVITNNREVWKSWCELQTPVFDSPGNVAPLCLPSDTQFFGGNYCGAPGSLERYSTAQCVNCIRRRACACDSEGCAVYAGEKSLWSFASGTVGTHPVLTRSLTLTVGTRTIVLEKAEAE